MTHRNKVRTKRKTPKITIITVTNAIVTSMSTCSFEASVSRTGRGEEEPGLGGGELGLGGGELGRGGGELGLGGGELGLVGGRLGASVITGSMR